MTRDNHQYDLVVIGSGPAGQNAAVQAAKIGKRVALVEREKDVGGACVHRGTIPSKTLRENALHLARFRQDAERDGFTSEREIELSSLMSRTEQVIRQHNTYMAEQLERNGVRVIHGNARFDDADTVTVTHITGDLTMMEAERFLIAAGSRPRTPEDIPVDHEHILDSDSILSMIYVPESLAVLGGGVIGSEYASIFSILGSRVTLIDAAPRPLRFLDEEMTRRFVAMFESEGGEYIGESRASAVYWDGVSEVVTTLDSGREIRTEKMLFALGRVPNLDGLDVEAAGVARTARGQIPVDGDMRTNVEKIYAAGDVAGPPGLASSAMEQGRRAACHAFGVQASGSLDLLPIGIYTVPEIASAGLNEEEARERYGDPLVGRCSFGEVARGQIGDNQDGLLKLVSDPAGEQILGVQIIGEGATELIHVGQMAMIGGKGIDAFVENIFNFPTLAEAYRLAALDVVEHRAGASRRDREEDTPAAAAS